jgi:hypothetical protein
MALNRLPGFGTTVWWCADIIVQHRRQLLTPNNDEAVAKYETQAWPDLGGTVSEQVEPMDYKWMMKLQLFRLC